MPQGLTHTVPSLTAVPTLPAFIRWGLHAFYAVAVDGLSKKVRDASSDESEGSASPQTCFVAEAGEERPCLEQVGKSF